MVTIIGQSADTPTTVVRLYPTGAIPVQVSQNILAMMGEASNGPAMTVMGLRSSSEVKNTYVDGPLCRNGVLAFYQGLQDGYFIRLLGDGYATATKELTDKLSVPAITGTLVAADDGIRGNSARVKFEDGTFKSHDVEYFPGNGGDLAEGPYYLAQRDLVGPWPVAVDKNTVKVNNVDYTLVYDQDNLTDPGLVYVDTNAGSLLFFEGDGPDTYDEIDVNIAYKTKKITVMDGSKTYPAIDNVSDQIKIEAVLAESTVVHYQANPLVTHMPANDTYVLAGGLNGGAIDADVWYEGYQILMQYLEMVKTGVTAVTLCKMSALDDNSYDLLDFAEGCAAEMEQQWEPCLWVVGSEEADAIDTSADVSKIIQIVSPHSHRNLLFVANPWGGEQNPPRTNGWVALAAREASLSLGDDSAERSSLNSLKAMQGLLTYYRKDTVRGFQNNRITCLVKEDAGLFPNWSRTVADDWQFRDAVDNRTINYVLRMLYAISKRFYFKKNIPPVRADYKQSIAQELNQLLKDYVIVKYILEVHGPGDKGYAYTDNGRVDVNLQIENVGHIKHIYINYGVGILQDSPNTVYAPEIFTQT
jgi:hypothetical protein